MNLSIEWDKEEVSPMRLLLISMFIAAGLTLGGVSSFANSTKTETNTQEMTLSGQISGIRGDSLIVKDNMGKVHKVIPAEPSELEYVKVGENVSIKMRDGRAVDIHKTANTGSSERYGSR